MNRWLVSMLSTLNLLVALLIILLGGALGTALLRGSGLGFVIRAGCRLSRFCCRMRRVGSLVSDREAFAGAGGRRAGPAQTGS